MAAQRQVTKTERAVDLLVGAHILFLIWIGVTFEGRTGLWNTLELIAPQMAMIGFLAVMFPFRIHTRLLWTVLMPLAAWLAIFIGFYCQFRLNHAPGYEPINPLWGIVPQTFIIYLLPLPLWMTLGLFGWQLEREGGGSLGRSLSLKELFSLIGVVCIAIGLLLDVVSMKEFTREVYRTHTYFFPHVVPESLRYCLVLAPCLFMGFRYRPPFAAICCVAWLLISCSINRQLISPALNNGQPASFFQLFDQSLTAPGVLLVSLVAARSCGFQLVRAKRLPSKSHRAAAKRPDLISGRVS